MIEVEPRVALRIGLVLLITGIIVTVYAALTYSAVECAGVEFVSNSCFVVSKPGIICVKGTGVSIPQLRKVNSSTISGCTVQYAVNKVGVYCIKGSLPKNASIIICYPQRVGSFSILYWLIGAGLVLLGGGILYWCITRTKTNEEEYLMEKYVIDEGTVCRSLSLARHICRVNLTEMSVPEFIRRATEFLSNELGYKQREIASTYAILVRGSMFGLGRKKPVTLLLYVGSDNEVILDFRVAPLQASGLYDLKQFADEVSLLLKNIRP